MDKCRVIEVSRPNSVTYLNWTPIFAGWVVRCRYKNGHKKDVCFKKIGVRAQNLLTGLGSIVYIIGGILCPSYGSLLVDFDNQ